jgi:hypothetical protein
MPIEEHPFHLCEQSPEIFPERYSIDLFVELIHSFEAYKSQQILMKAKLVSEMEVCIQSSRLANQETSEWFNPLFYFNIRETLNSRILADLLDPNFKHGQYDLFLKEFLKHIGMKYSIEDRWHISCESENVDIVLSADSPKRVIVIENKINGAIDQPNQLYRYYKLKIASHFEPAKQNPERYKIVYLTKYAEKTCSDYSIFSADGKERVPEEIITNLTFRSDIKEILTNCLTELNPNNYRMRAFINFLIEHTTK